MSPFLAPALLAPESSYEAIGNAITPASTLPSNNASALTPSNTVPLVPSNQTQVWTCPEVGCGSRTFARRTELLRHQKKHAVNREFACVAQDCRRTGRHGFTRKDKLIDHMLAGHDEEALFACPSLGCVRSLTRDMLTLHAQHDTAATRLGHYRVCPMPRCSFRIHAWRKPLDELRTHIIEQHDREGRRAYAGVLRNRGYEPVMVDIVCPVCFHASQSHKDFQVHLVTAHGRISQGELDTLGSTNGNLQSPSLAVQQILSALPLIRQERRVLLSLWPQFEACPVWEDIRCPLV